MNELTISSFSVFCTERRRQNETQVLVRKTNNTSYEGKQGD